MAIFSLRTLSLHTSLLLAGAVALALQPLAAQGSRRTLKTEVDFVKEPSGVVLARLGRGTSVTAGASKGSWQEVTVEGWVIGNAMRDDKRDGFDVAVNLAVGTPIREAMGGGATLGLARAGALFNRLETKSGWVHVQRTGWVSRTALEIPPKAQAPPPKSPPAAATTAAATPAAKPDSSSPSVTITAGTEFSALPNGTPVGTLEIPVKGEVVEQREGWSRVQIDAWVRNAAIGATTPGAISAADIRAEPDRYVGQTVDWSLQIIGVQKADELRPELPPGQPYVLARGPLPETGFVYLIVRAEEADRFKALPPLTTVRVRATIRAGRTRFLPTPVLTFVRRLD